MRRKDEKAFWGAFTLAIVIGVLIGSYFFTGAFTGGFFHSRTKIGTSSVEVDSAPPPSAYIMKKDRTELFNSTGGNFGGRGDPYNASSQNVLMVEHLEGTRDGFTMPTSGVADSCRGKKTDKIFIWASSHNTEPLRYHLFWWDHDEPGRSPKYCMSGGGQHGPADKGPIFKNPAISLDFITAPLEHRFIQDANLLDAVISPASGPITTSKKSNECSLVVFRTMYDELGFEFGFGTQDGVAVRTDIVQENPYHYVGDLGRDHFTREGIKIYNSTSWGNFNQAKFDIPSKLKLSCK